MDEVDDMYPKTAEKAGPAVARFTCHGDRLVRIRP
jgi:hypothetical protein